MLKRMGQNGETAKPDQGAARSLLDKASGLEWVLGLLASASTKEQHSLSLTGSM